MMNITKRFAIQLTHEPFTRTIETGEQDVHDEVAEVAIKEHYGTLIGKKKKAADADTESETENSDTGSNGSKSDDTTVTTGAKPSPVIPGFNK